MAKKIIDPKVTLSTQMLESHAELVKQAADAAGLNMSNFIRACIIDLSAKKLNKPVPDLSSYRTRGTVEMAAERLHMSVKDFMRMAAEEVAKAQLGRMNRVS